MNITEFTAREIQILKLYSEGKPLRKIAEELHVSIYTVRTHARKIVNRLEAQSMSHAVVIALKLKLIS